jgi:hypothetical protein
MKTPEALRAAATLVFFSILLAASPALAQVTPVQHFPVGALQYMCPATVRYASAETAQGAGEWLGETSGDIKTFNKTASFFKVFTGGPDNQGRPYVRCQYQDTGVIVSLYRTYTADMTCAAAQDHKSYSCQKK